MRPLVTARPPKAAIFSVLLAALLAMPHGVYGEPDRPGAIATLSIVATTDLHGHLESLPWFAGYLANLRAQRRGGGGAVVLVDAGDMFQGTLESNLGEGAAVIRAYNQLGYDAVAIGNHEFDFGPAGPRHVPHEKGDDPRGALKARARQARFPFLAANLEMLPEKKPPPWPNVRPFHLLKKAGIAVGLIGVTTAGTLLATHPKNVAGLGVRPLADAITEAARAARAAGAEVVVVASHAGGHCRRFEDPRDLSSCDGDEEIFQVARALPAGLVDVVAAGHTHQGVAHEVAGVAIVQGFAHGRAFARVDVAVDKRTGRVVEKRIFAPQTICTSSAPMAPLLLSTSTTASASAACAHELYEGRMVSFDPRVAAVLREDVRRVAGLRRRRIGVEILRSLVRARGTESALGNWAADLMKATTPQADVAFINGGSLRADLPKGPLTYGDLHQAFPFDDGLSLVPLRGRDLKRIIARNLSRTAGILSLSGLFARARCADRRLVVDLHHADGRPVADQARLWAVTNGYLASGGDGLLSGIAQGRDPDPTPMRDRFAALLGRAAPGSSSPVVPLDGSDRRLLDPQKPRLAYPGSRPVRCP